MNPSVAVIIPFRATTDERRTNLDRAVADWHEIGWPVLLGDHPGESFCRGTAINRAAEDPVAQAVDVLMIADADIILGASHQAKEGALQAREGGRYVVCFSHLHCLNRQGTDRVYEGKTPRGQRDYLESVSMIWGGVFAVPRQLFDEVQGFDERFIGYGAEDLAFLVSCSTLGGPKLRITGVAWHMTHEPNPDRDHMAANGQLASRYRSVDGDPDGVRALIAERP